MCSDEVYLFSCSKSDQCKEYDIRRLIWYQKKSIVLDMILSNKYHWHLSTNFCINLEVYTKRLQKIVLTKQTLNHF